METTKTPSVRQERIDPSIENAKSEDCNLSILLSENGLVFSILRNDLKKFIVLGDYLLESDQGDKAQLFSFKKQLKGEFQEYAIGYQTPKYCLFPLTLFKPEELTTYAKFQFSVEEGDELAYDELSAQGLVIIYAISSEVQLLLEENFHGIIYHHAAYFGITHYTSLYKNQPGEHIHLNIWGQTAEYYVIINGKLQLCTQFNFESNEDLLYFTLNVYEQLGLNPEQVPLKASGEMDRHFESWRLLEKYVRFVELEKRPTGFQYSHEFQSIEEHRYNRIFQAAACV